MTRAYNMIKSLNSLKSICGYHPHADTEEPVEGLASSPENMPVNGIMIPNGVEQLKMEA